MPAKNKEGRIFLLDRAKAAQTGTIWLSIFQEEKLVRDLISGANLANPGGFTIDEGGSVATFNGAQAQNLAFALPILDNTIIAARVKATAAQAANPGAAFGVYASSGTQSGFGVGFDTANAVGCAYIDNSAAGTTARSAGSLNTWYTVFVQILNNGTTYAWINGKPATTGQGSTHASSFAALNEISIGAQHRSAGFLRNFKGNIEWASILNLPVGSNNVLTDSFAEALYESNYPYSLEAKPSRIWVEGVSAAALAGNATGQASGTGSLTTAVPITAAALSLASAGGALTTAIPLGGVAASVSSAAAAAITQILLAAAAADQAGASAGLSSGIPLTANAAGQAAAPGDLTAGGGLSVSAQASASGSAVLTAQIRITADALAQSLSAAAMSSGIILTVNAITQAAAQGSLATIIQMIAAAAANASASATFSGSPAALSATAAAQAGAGAQLTVGIQLTTTALGQAGAQGALTTSIDLTATALAAALAGGGLTTQANFVADAFAQAAAPATLGDVAAIAPAPLNMLTRHRRAVGVQASARRAVNFYVSHHAP